MVARVLRDGRFDAVIHLAAVSNDPCSFLDPILTREVNLLASADLIALAKEAGVPRFISASSASVYGIKETENVTEDLPLEPITIYAETKAATEKILRDAVDDRFCGVSVRAATVCGWAPRLRLDLTINILTYQALVKRQIRVFGGSQMRPNIHIEDLTDFYRFLLTANPSAIRGESFNVSKSNATVMDLAEMIRQEIDPATPIEIVPTEDNRSYHLSSERAKNQLGFVPMRPLSRAVADLRKAFDDGRVPDPDAPMYRNVDVMKARPDLAHWSAPAS